MQDLPSYSAQNYRDALKTYRGWGLNKENANNRFWKSVFCKFHRFGPAQQAALEQLVSEAGLDLPSLLNHAGPDPLDVFCDTEHNPNWPSKTGRPSGKRRGNNPSEVEA